MRSRGVSSSWPAAGAWWFFATRTDGPPQVEATPVPTQTSARFVNIEGSVQVKFSGTLQWVSADRGVVLNKSDLVRTGSGSSAEVRFFDGTVFQIRPDSLVTIEETSEDPEVTPASRRRSHPVGRGELPGTESQRARHDDHLDAYGAHGGERGVGR